jgi:sec-independent protein translocase protein TatB
MGSLSFSEIVVIVLVILIVFGPNRMPDLARKAGELMNKVRDASSTMTDSLGADYEETVEPLLNAKRDFDGIKEDLARTMTTFGQAAKIPDGNGANDPSGKDAADSATGDEPAAEVAEPDPAADERESAIPNAADDPDDTTAAT